MTTETTAARAADLSNERATLRETATMRLDDFDADFGPSQAVTLALYLGLIAPSQDKTMQAAELAGRIASVWGMSCEDLEPCKAVAIRENGRNSTILTPTKLAPTNSSDISGKFTIWGSLRSRHLKVRYPIGTAISAIASSLEWLLNM